MYRLKEDAMAELEIKKSRFLCYLHKSFSEADAKDFIQQIRKLHPNARHHCYAFIIGEHNEWQRSNDDGEPKGTAGVPMLECLANRQMQDIVAVTVRYFGGIKLGAGGLIRAYSKSVSHALDQAIITQKQKRLVYSLTFGYEWIGKLDAYFRQHDIDIIEKDYGELVSYTWLCKEPLNNDLSELSNGRFSPTFVKEQIVDVELQFMQSEET